MLKYQMEINRLSALYYYTYSLQIVRNRFFSVDFAFGRAILYVLSFSLFALYERKKRKREDMVFRLFVLQRQKQNRRHHDALRAQLA